MEKQIVKVRFAPSPTGFLHIGSARTALFNWLFARHNNGKFLLRIEDTDIERSKKEFLDEILDSLKWLGLDWDGKPVFQSKRVEIYRKFADELLAKGLAYKAEGNAIIFKIPQGKTITINDLVHGQIKVDSDTIKDQVMIKSDGTPTYNFACVIDDADMSITHVIRGDDHISNTPKQILFYEALGFKIPEFAHVPLILGKDRSRMSKRHGATSIKDYRESGYLPAALLNFIALLGFSAGENREIMELKDLIKEFEIKDIKSANAVFDIDKLNWMNGQYIKNMPAEALLELLLPLLLKERFIKTDYDRNWLLSVIKLFQSRIKTLCDFIWQTEFVFVDDVKFDTDAFSKILKKEGVVEKLKMFSERLKEIQDYGIANLEKDIRDFLAEKNITGKEIIHPVRVALTGKTVSPGIFEIMSVLGRQKTLNRLNRAIKELSK